MITLVSQFVNFSLFFKSAKVSQLGDKKEAYVLGQISLLSHIDII